MGEKKEKGFKAFAIRWSMAFFAAAVIGWLYEVFLEVVVYRWGFSNRGVLFGPWLPVYGVGLLLFGAICAPLFRKKLPKWKEVPLVFLLCMLSATALELLTSYVLEALTGHWLWETYRDYAINFQGRIALSPSIRFGLGGLVLVYGLLPLIGTIQKKVPEKVLVRILAVLWILFAVDLVCTILF